MPQRKNAVITGGNRGIGYAIAEALAEAGYDLHLCARNAESLRNAREQLTDANPGINVYTHVCDVSVKEQLKAFAESVRQQCETLDVLVNNAGNFIPGSVLTEPDGAVESMIETNLYSAYYLTRYLYDMLDTEKGGYIFNICSTASLNAYPNGGAYGISKFAMLGWSKNLREECKNTKVRVTAIIPGATWTDSWKASGLPKERFMMPEDVARAVTSALAMTESAMIEEIILRPQQGDV